METLSPATGLIGLLIQGGAVAIALVALYIIYKLTTQLSNTLEDIAEQHRASIDRNTDAWNRNTEVLAKINERIR